MFAGNAAAALPLAVPTSALVISPSTGDSGTEIWMQVAPADRTCPGVGATWTTFVVLSDVDPDLVRHDGSGPVGGTVARPALALESYTDGEPLVSMPVGPDGSFGVAPAIGFRFLEPGTLPDGRYRVGVACAGPPASGGRRVTTRTWWVEMRIDGDPAAGPAGFRWTVGAPERGLRVSPTVLDPPSESESIPAFATGGAGGAPPRVEAEQQSAAAVNGPSVVQDVFVVVPGPTTTTTTTPAPTSTSVSTTTTAATTTTILGSAAVTTTTTTTTTTPALGAGGPVPATNAGSGSAGAGTGGTGSSGTNRFPRTGSEIRSVLLWGLALVVFGRLAVVTSRSSDRRADPAGSESAAAAARG